MRTKLTQTLASDWFGTPLAPFVQFSLKFNETELKFSALRQAPALVKPDCKDGEFCPELWRFDVAELFLRDARAKSYLEVNLAPKGAWWMCWFDDIRQPRETQPSFSGVQAAGNQQSEAWKTSLSIPLELLPPLEFLTYNVTFILNSPAQTFHSLAPLPGQEPDFHQPNHFLSLTESLPS